MSKIEQYMPIILSSPLFADIRETELPELLRCLTAVVRRYGKQEMILLAGQKPEAVGLVCEGAAQVLKEDFMGNRTILTKLGPGELFAEAFACARVEQLPVSVEAAADSEILFLDYRRIVTTCPSTCGFHTRLIENMLGILAGKNVLLNQKIEFLSKRTTKEKLVAYLSEQAKRAGSSRFAIHFNRQELADFLCVERSAMSAELSSLKRQGVLDYRRNEFELFDL